MATGKSVHNNVLDAALQYVKDKVTHIFVMSVGTDVELWTNVSANHLASTALTSVLASFSIADGSGSNGRKLTVPAVVDIDIWGNGNAVGVALVDNNASGDAKVLYVTSCTTKALTSGDKVNVPTWEIQLTDPA